MEDPSTPSRPHPLVPSLDLTAANLDSPGSPTVPIPFSPATPIPPSNPPSSSRPRPRTQRELRESRKADFVSTERAIASKHTKPDNIHREVLPTFVPQHIQDNVELCYLRLEQHGWFPLANVDPEGSYGDGKKEHPSYALWYEVRIGDK